MNDISFYLPAVSFAKLWADSLLPDTSAFLYHFNCPNPWDGAWRGHATHVLDIAFLFQNYGEWLEYGQCKVARRMAADFVRFVHGEAPWQAVGRDGVNCMVYDAAVDGDEDDSVFVGSHDPNNDVKTGRRHIIEQTFGKERFDDLLEVLSMLLAGR
jgi:carboxylesterase type B